MSVRVSEVISWSRCCRVGGMDNVVTTAMTQYQGDIIDWPCSRPDRHDGFRWYL
jgi:hypothetical protein